MGKKSPSFRFCKGEIADAPRIITTICTLRIDVGIMPEPIVFTTSPPPIMAPKNTPIPLIHKAACLFRTAPAPYAIPIEAAAPLAPMFMAKNKAIMNAKMVIVGKR